MLIAMHALSTCVSIRVTGVSVCHWVAGDVLLEVQRYVKARVIECEECIFTASGQADSPEEPEAAETGAALLKSLMSSDPVNHLDTLD
jgi:hypothetical protein